MEHAPALEAYCTSHFRRVSAFLLEKGMRPGLIYLNENK